MTSVTTQVYKTVGHLRLTVDIQYPETFDSKTSPVLIHFHGGFLIFGQKDTFPPHWLINACCKRGWAYATPSYRLLPESAGTEIVKDAVDAARWVSENVCKSGNLVVAGSSAGGYLAMAAATHADAPPIRAILSVYGMLDPLAPRYIKPGQAMVTPVQDLDSVVKNIYATKEKSPAIDGYPFPPNPATDTRFSWMKAIHEAGIYPDLITGIRGLAKQINQHGPDAVPEKFHYLFPATFGLHSTLPPTALLHGDADKLVSSEISKNVAKDLGAMGVKVLLEVVPEQDHGFDVRGVASDIDIASASESCSFRSSLTHVFYFLDQAIEC